MAISQYDENKIFVIVGGIDSEYAMIPLKKA